MNVNNQKRAPLYEALERFRKQRVVPFDVPGHKRGRGNPELTAFLGQQCVGVDVNSMKPLDNLCHPVSVIREAEELAADAFGAAHAFLMVGGTTSSVQSMVLTVCKRGDEIILPRNVHRSVLNALVLCGAVPVYVNPEVDKRLGISLGMKREQVEKALTLAKAAAAHDSYAAAVLLAGYEKDKAAAAALLGDFRAVAAAGLRGCASTPLTADAARRALSLADAAIQRLAAQVNPKITLSVLAAKLG